MHILIEYLIYIYIYIYGGVAFIMGPQRCRPKGGDTTSGDFRLGPRTAAQPPRGGGEGEEERGREREREGERERENLTKTTSEKCLVPNAPPNFCRRFFFQKKVQHTFSKKMPPVFNPPQPPKQNHTGPKKLKIRFCVPTGAALHF